MQTLPNIVLLTGQDRITCAVNLDHVTHISRTGTKGSKISFVGSSEPILVEVSPDEILPLFLEQRAKLINSLYRRIE